MARIDYSPLGYWHGRYRSCQFLVRDGQQVVQQYNPSSRRCKTSMPRPQDALMKAAWDVVRALADVGVVFPIADALRWCLSVAESASKREPRIMVYGEDGAWAPSRVVASSRGLSASAYPLGRFYIGISDETFAYTNMFLYPGVRFAWFVAGDDNVLGRVVATPHADGEMVDDWLPNMTNSRLMGSRYLVGSRYRIDYNRGIPRSGRYRIPTLGACVSSYRDGGVCALLVVNPDGEIVHAYAFPT